MIYELYMSKGPNIKCDSEDLEKLKANTEEFMVQLKQGIVRPPFVISIVPTREDEWKEKLKIEEINGRPTVTGRTKVRKIGDLMNTKKYDRLAPGPKQLADKKTPTP